MPRCVCVCVSVCVSVCMRATDVCVCVCVCVLCGELALARLQVGNFDKMNKVNERDVSVNRAERDNQNNETCQKRGRPATSDSEANTRTHTTAAQ